MAIDRSLNYGRQVLRRLATESAPFSVAVDLGAGHGDDLAMLADVSPGAALHGVEAFPPYQEELLRRGVVVHGLNVERDTLPFLDESVDLILANQTMEHLKDIFWVMHEISRVLRVGGSLLLGVPNLASLHNRILLAIGRQPSVIQNRSAHVRGYTRRDLIDFMDAGHPRGYRLAGWGGSNFYPFGATLAKPLAAMLPSLAWGLFTRFEKVAEYSGGFLSYPIEAQLESQFYLGPGRAASALPAHD